MKKNILTLMFALHSLCLCAQVDEKFTKSQSRLIDIIRQSPVIESECLSLHCIQKSVLYAQADSLFKSLSLNKVYSLFKDSSYTLKYYSFQSLVKLNELQAWNALVAIIQDSTKIAFHFDDYMGSDPFNKILANEYENFIYLKYFKRNDPKRWIAKQRQLCRLFSKAHIKTRYYCI